MKDCAHEINIPQVLKVKQFFILLFFEADVRDELVEVINIWRLAHSEVFILSFVSVDHVVQIIVFLKGGGFDLKSYLLSSVCPVLTIFWWLVQQLALLGEVYSLNESWSKIPFQQTYYVVLCKSV